MVSVIVPVYKAEKYLCRCIDSVLAQTYQDFELILVDDGSPDGCPKICDEYARKDDRIKVIHKENGGVSSARNAGIDASTGEYLMFVDADDYVSATYIENLMGDLSRYDDADLVIGDFVVDGEGFSHDAWEKGEEKVSLEQLKTDFDSYKVLLTIVFSKVYIKRLLGENRFDPTISIGEDFVFNLNYFSKCRNILFVGNADYFYNVGNASSAMSVYNKKRFIYEERVYRAAKLFRYGEIVCNGDLRDEYFCSVGMRQMVDICLQDASWKDKKKEMSAVLNNNLYKSVVRRHYKEQGFKTNILRILCKNRNYTLIRLAVAARFKIKKLQGKA